MPALTVSSVTGWSGTLETLGITVPGPVRVRAAIWEYPLVEGTGWPIGTGDALPGEPGAAVIPLVFADVEPPAPDAAPPAVTDLEAIPPRPRPPRPGAKVARRRAARAVVARYRLSEPAAVAFRLQRRGARGRYLSLRRSSRDAGTRGANAVRLRRLVAGLRPGAYRLVATARDAAGNRGAPRRVRFRLY